MPKQKKMTEKEKEICGYCKCSACQKEGRKAYAWYFNIKKDKFYAICELCYKI